MTLLHTFVVHLLPSFTAEKHTGCSVLAVSSAVGVRVEN